MFLTQIKEIELVLQIEEKIKLQWIYKFPIQWFLLNKRWTKTLARF